MPIVQNYLNNTFNYFAHQNFFFFFFFILLPSGSYCSGGHFCLEHQYVRKPSLNEKDVLNARRKDYFLLVLSSGMNHLRAHYVQRTFCTCTSAGLQ